MVNPSRLYKICKAFHAAATDTLILKTKEASLEDDVATGKTLPSPNAVLENSPTQPQYLLQQDYLTPSYEAQMLRDFSEKLVLKHPPDIKEEDFPEEKQVKPKNPKDKKLYPKKEEERWLDNVFPTSRGEDVGIEEKLKFYDKMQKEKHEREIKELKKQMDELLEETKELHR